MNAHDKMKVLMIEKERFSDFVNELRDSFGLYGPVRQGDMVNFMPIEDAVQMDLSFQNSRLSPKSLFLPQSERMFEYSLDPDSEDAHILKEAPKDYSPRAVIGIRPCDTKAFCSVPDQIREDLETEFRLLLLYQVGDTRFELEFGLGKGTFDEHGLVYLAAFKLLTPCAHVHSLFIHAGYQTEALFKGILTCNWTFLDEFLVLIITTGT